MMTKKMSDKYDYDNARDAHWRIDDLADVVAGLTEVVENHGKDLNSIKQAGRAIKHSLYTLAFIIATSEIGLIEVFRKYIGI